MPLPEGYRTEGRTQGDFTADQRGGGSCSRAPSGPSSWAAPASTGPTPASALQELAEKVGAPIYLNDMGRGTVSQDHPQFMSRTRRTAFGEADVDPVRRHDDRLPPALRAAASTRPRR